MIRLLQPHIPWLIGFLLTVNLYLVPSMAASPRATDLGGLICGIWILMRLAQGRQPMGPVVLMGLVCILPLGWFVASILGGDRNTTFQTLRWLLAAPTALAMLALIHRPDQQRRFAWGLVVGAGVGVMGIIMQWLGLESLLQKVGLSSSQSAYYHYVYLTVRIPGLHGQHNASSTVISLAVPAVLYLYFRWRCSVFVVLATLVGFLVALHLTSTRSPLVVAIPALIYAFIAAREVGRGVVIGTVLLAILVPLVVIYGPPGGWSRWSDTGAIEANLGERLSSNQGALELTFKHPQGSGVTQGKARLFDASGSGATHNAFLQAAIHLGAPLGLAIFAALIALALRGLAGRDDPLFLPGLLAVQTLGVFMFEEHLNNPTFIVLTCWFLISVIRSGKSPADDSSDSPT